MTTDQDRLSGLEALALEILRRVESIKAEDTSYTYAEQLVFLGAGPKLAQGVLDQAEEIKRLKEQTNFAANSLQAAEIRHYLEEITRLKREVNAQYIAYCEEAGPCDDEYCDCRNPRDLPYP